MANAEVGSPIWYVEKLSEKLIKRRASNKLLQDYYDGMHPFEVATVRYKSDFIRMLNEVTDNWMPLIVDAVEERLNVQGFRFGETSDADDRAWRIWQRNYLDADFPVLVNTALTTGYGYTLVWGDSDDNPIITVEHPNEMIVATSPGDRRHILAGLKNWHDEWSDAEYCNLYLPDNIFKFVSGKNGDWELISTIPNPLGEVPIVQFSNRSNMSGVGKSEFKEGITTQDQINKLVKDMMVASEFAAFPQRWATGLVEERDENGEVVNPFTASLTRIFAVENDAAKFGQFQPADLNNYVRAIENRIQSLASRTRTPPHYLLGQSGQFPSGESLRAAETGLSAKVRRRATNFGESLESTLRLAFAVQGDNVKRYQWNAETIWGDPESRSEAQLADSLVKLLSIGVPMRALWERWGFTNEEIKRFRRYAQEEALAMAMKGNGQPITVTSRNVPATTPNTNSNGTGQSNTPIPTVSNQS